MKISELEDKNAKMEVEIENLNNKKRAEFEVLKLNLVNNLELKYIFKGENVWWNCANLLFWNWLNLEKIF